MVRRHPVLTRLLYLCATFCAWPSVPIHAAKPKVDLNLVAKRSTLTAQQSLHLTVTIVLWDRSRYQSLRLPSHKLFLLRDKSIRQKKEAVFRKNKRYIRRTWRIQLRYEPQKLGTYILSPLQVRVAGTGFRSQALRITVAAKAGALPPLALDIPETLNIPPKQRDAFLYTQIRPRRVYRGQAAVLSYHLLRRSPLQRIGIARFPSLTDFWSIERKRASFLGNWKIRMIRGQSYKSVLVLRYVVYPLRTGALTIPSLRLRIQRGFSARSQMLLNSPTATLQALTLPQKNRPKDFVDAHVGRLTPRLQTPTQTLKTGQPIIVKLIVEGYGYLQQLTLPALDLPQGLRQLSRREEVKVQAAQRLEARQQGQKIAHYTLLATKAGRYRLPPIRFVSFDPWRGSYRVQLTKPTVLSVKQGLVLTTSTSTAGRKRPVHSQAPSRRRLWIALLVSGSLLCLGLLFFWLRRRSHTVQAPVEAEVSKEALAHFQSWCKSQGTTQADPLDDPSFATHLHAALTEQLGYPTHGLSRAALQTALLDAGWDRSFTEIVRSLLAQSEQRRYAPWSTSHDRAVTARQLTQLQERWPHT